MDFKRKTKSQMIRESVKLRKQVGELEAWIKNQKQKGGGYDICY